MRNKKDKKLNMSEKRRNEKENSKNLRLKKKKEIEAKREIKKMREQAGSLYNSGDRRRIPNQELFKWK